MNAENTKEKLKTTEYSLNDSYNNLSTAMENEKELFRISKYIDDFLTEEYAWKQQINATETQFYSKYVTEIVKKSKEKAEDAETVKTETREILLNMETKIAKITNEFSRLEEKLGEQRTIMSEHKEKFQSHLQKIKQLKAEIEEITKYIQGEIKTSEGFEKQRNNDLQNLKDLTNKVLAHKQNINGKKTELDSKKGEVDNLSTQLETDSKEYEKAVIDGLVGLVNTAKSEATIALAEIGAIAGAVDDAKAKLTSQPNVENIESGESLKSKAQQELDKITAIVTQVTELQRQAKQEGKASEAIREIKRQIEEELNKCNLINTEMTNIKAQCSNNNNLLAIKELDTLLQKVKEKKQSITTADGSAQSKKNGVNTASGKISEIIEEAKKRKTSIAKSLDEKVIKEIIEEITQKKQDIENEIQHILNAKPDVEGLLSNMGSQNDEIQKIKESIPHIEARLTSRGDKENEKREITQIAEECTGIINKAGEYRSFITEKEGKFVEQRKAIDDLLKECSLRLKIATSENLKTKADEINSAYPSIESSLSEKLNHLLQWTEKYSNVMTTIRYNDEITNSRAQALKSTLASNNQEIESIKQDIRSKLELLTATGEKMKAAYKLLNDKNEEISKLTSSEDTTIQAVETGEHVTKQKEQYKIVEDASKTVDTIKTDITQIETKLKSVIQQLNTTQKEYTGVFVQHEKELATIEQIKADGEYEKWTLIPGNKNIQDLKHLLNNDIDTVLQNLSTEAEQLKNEIKVNMGKLNAIVQVVNAQDITIDIDSVYLPRVQGITEFQNLKKEEAEKAKNKIKELNGKMKEFIVNGKNTYNDKIKEKINAYKQELEEIKTNGASYKTQLDELKESLKAPIEQLNSCTNIDDLADTVSSIRKIQRQIEDIVSKSNEQPSKKDAKLTQIDELVDQLAMENTEKENIKTDLQPLTTSITQSYDAVNGLNKEIEKSLESANKLAEKIEMIIKRKIFLNVVKEYRDKSLPEIEKAKNISETIFSKVITPAKYEEKFAKNQSIASKLSELKTEEAKIPTFIEEVDAIKTTLEDLVTKATEEYEKIKDVSTAETETIKASFTTLSDYIHNSHNQFLLSLKKVRDAELNKHTIGNKRIACSQLISLEMKTKMDQDLHSLVTTKKELQQLSEPILSRAVELERIIKSTYKEDLQKIDKMKQETTNITNEVNEILDNFNQAETNVTSTTQTSASLLAEMNQLEVSENENKVSKMEEKTKQILDMYEQVQQKKTDADNLLNRMKILRGRDMLVANESLVYNTKMYHDIILNNLNNNIPICQKWNELFDALDDIYTTLNEYKKEIEGTLESNGDVRDAERINGIKAEIQILTINSRSIENLIFNRLVQLVSYKEKCTLTGNKAIDEAKKIQQYIQENNLKVPNQYSRNLEISPYVENVREEVEKYVRAANEKLEAELNEESKAERRRGPFEKSVDMHVKQMADKNSELAEALHEMIDDYLNHNNINKNRLRLSESQTVIRNQIDSIRSRKEHAATVVRELENALRDSTGWSHIETLTQSKLDSYVSELENMKKLQSDIPVVLVSVNGQKVEVRNVIDAYNRSNQFHEKKELSKNAASKLLQNYDEMERQLESYKPEVRELIDTMTKLLEVLNRKKNSQRRPSSSSRNVIQPDGTEPVEIEPIEDSDHPYDYYQKIKNTSDQTSSNSDSDSGSGTNQKPGEGTGNKSQGSYVKYAVCGSIVLVLITAGIVGIAAKSSDDDDTYQENKHYVYAEVSGIANEYGEDEEEAAIQLNESDFEEGID